MTNHIGIKQTMQARTTFNLRLKNKLTRTLVDAIFHFNMEKVLYSGKRVNRIIMYHGVDLKEEKRFNSRFIGLENFKKQMLFLKKHTNVISLGDFFEKKFNPNKSNIAITFDDGYLNNYKYVVPLLNELKIEATIYVTALNNTDYDILWADFTDLAGYFCDRSVTVENERYIKNRNGKFVSENEGILLNEVIKRKGNLEYKLSVFQAFDKNETGFKQLNEFDDYWRLMTDEQIREVDQSKYVKIGSHSFWHNNLSNIPFSDAGKELLDAKNYLENLLQREVNDLAYPDGSYTREIIDFAYNIGFKYQLSCDGYNFNEDISDHRIKDRVGLYPAFSWCNQMHTLMTKPYDRRI